jgi:hypothetical protein
METETMMLLALWPALLGLAVSPLAIAHGWLDPSSRGAR